MRIGVVRTDLNRIYLSDLENTSQRNFSSEPPGQSRYISRPTDAQLTAALVAGGAVLSLLGTVTGATKDTNPNNTLRIRTSSTASFSVIAVSASDTAANATIVSELNTAFLAAGLPVIAKLGNSDNTRIQLEGTVKGPTAYLELDTVANGSTLNTALGYPVGGQVMNGLTVAALRTAVYPTSTTINVATATIVALGASPDVTNGDFANLTTAQQTAIVDAIANAVAPKLIETGRALLSFDRGVISKLRSTGFQPGGTRSGLPAGVAVAVLANDGSTVFTV